MVNNTKSFEFVNKYFLFFVNKPLFYNDNYSQKNLVLNMGFGLLLILQIVYNSKSVICY
jgi:hypothetical protein